MPTEQHVPTRSSVGLRIAVVGNQSAYGYRLTDWLRQDGQEAKLYLISGKDDGERDRISNVDPGISIENVPWIHSLTTFDDRFGTLHDEHDVVLTVGPSGLKSVRRINGLPICHFAMGSEIHTSPFMNAPRKMPIANALEKVFYLLTREQEARKNRAYTEHFRSCLEKVDAIIAVHSSMTQAAAKLDLQSKLRAWPFPEDVTKNHSRIDQTLVQKLNKQFERYDRVILWLSRISYTNPSDPANKRPDFFLNALEELVAGDRRNIRAVVGLHGPDSEAFRHEVQRRSLDSHIEFVEHLPFTKMLSYMSIDNGIVCDAMNPLQNLPGGLSREALSLGSALVTYVDRKGTDLLYGANSPCLSASDSSTCYHALRTFVDMTREEFDDHRRSTQDWARAHLDHRNLIPKLVSILQESVYLRHANACVTCAED